MPHVRSQFCCLLLLLLWLPLQAARAQITPNPDETFVINLRDADIRALAEQVAEITDRTLILDPNVTGIVTVISTEALDKDGVWELFQSVLAVQGYAALPSGNLWRIVPQQVIREGGGAIESTDQPGRLDVVTRLVPLQNFPAATAVGALRPLVASFGYIEAVVDTNTLVITDTAENVARIESIARALDADDGQQVFTIPIRNANAADVGAAIQNVLGTDAAGTVGGPRVTVDARANLLLLSADQPTYDMVLAIVADLDVPGRAVPSAVPVTRVYNLRFADATALADVLRGLVGSSGAGVQATNPVAEALPPAVDPATGQPVAPVPPPVSSFAAEEITIQPALESNAIVVRARAEVQADLAALIAELDQRRPQVLIEAAIVEVSGDISEQLGVQLGLGAGTPPGGFAATSFSTAGPSLDGILSLLGVPAAGAISGGVSIGLAREDRFGLLLQALGQSSKANLLSTPSITTLDNQAAEIVVGQNVPFRTGSFDRGGDGSNAFTTIERQDVGITMRVVPRVNQGDVIQLDIAQEVSSLVNTSVAGAADLITNRRSIQTTVLADNGGTIVLGGLITDDRQSTRSEVPGLGRAPLIGGLFRSRSESNRRQTLFVFLRATILRDGADTAQVASDRFQRLRAIEAVPVDEQGSLLTAPQPIRRLPVEIEGLY
ncbi:MAG: type II secretion system secretin GspD [Rhodobacteraceae bacterium]|jgi:general secretion pathway protein D|nr:type II secretion system secretin GspD [Paracoccaceae bacterium]